MKEKLAALAALKLAEPVVVVGAGVSGLAALRYLKQAGYCAYAVDERKTGDGIVAGDFQQAELLAEVGTIVLSPGVDSRLPAIAQSKAEIINDVEIFARLIQQCGQKPIYGVTGSNGKSTVVTLLCEALQAQDRHVELCGNIGRSVLEAYFASQYCDGADVYVLELSSYQLEYCPSLRLNVGAVLNLSPDHLDRYDSYEAYVKAKQNLVLHSGKCVLNQDDEQCVLMGQYAQTAHAYQGEIIWFGGESAHCVRDNAIYLDNQPLISTEALKLQGKHNYANVLVAVLMLKLAGDLHQRAIEAIARFVGLAHRVQWIAEIAGVRYIDDSKATNIGATVAALSAFHAPIHLILGGVGKGQDFRLLAQALLTAEIRQILVIGKENQALIAALEACGLAYENCVVLEKALEKARAKACAGEMVMLSPACASLDQYVSYAQRGEAFAEGVRAWL